MSLHTYPGSIKCAFSMGYDRGDRFHYGQNMKFTREITNIGKAYDKQTGLFTAPVEGIYAFHVVVTTLAGGKEIHFMVNAGFLFFCMRRI